MGVPTVIATFEKSAKTRVRLALDDYAGHQLVDLRIMALLTESSGVWTPTRKGVALDVALLPELSRAFQQAEAKAREMGLIGGPS